MMRHFLDIDELTSEELEHILDLSTQPETPPLLDGKGVALLFEKPSARTRNAMEMAVVQLGGHPVYIRPDELGLDTRETVEDVTRTFACYHEILGARVHAHSTVERMAALDVVPVVNLLSDKAHPMQALGDLLTMRGELSVLEDRTITFIGDANNVALSLAKAAGLAGMKFRLAGPSGYSFSGEHIEEISRMGGEVEIFRSPFEAVADADVVYTDTWASMGKENEAETRREAFQEFRVDANMMSAAGEKAIFLHCLPAKRGNEVTDEVLDGAQSRVWLQAENRMHTARGLLAWIIEEANNE
jgi:ornithine carbamoyltransferase